MVKLLIENFHMTFNSRMEACEFLVKLDKLCASSINPLKNEFHYDAKIPNYEENVSSYPEDQ